MKEKETENLSFGDKAVNHGSKEQFKQARYKIMIDRDVKETSQECMMGREILTLANKIPAERFQLNVRMKGGRVTKVGYDETICFSTPGIEKFMTIPLDQTEGGR
jgi:hypothetical protein